ncbi:MAG: hypothetical protein FWF79_00840 [Defluviitaleaceae bacterium]|nr:hypothetical protein [Defluviitaleaceae bacterium]
MREDLFQIIENISAGGKSLRDLMPEMPQIPDGTPDAWDFIISMRDSLPHHEQRLVELMVKLDEVTELVNELTAARV